MMNREEAIYKAKHLRKVHPNICIDAEDFWETVIAALDQEPCDDAISRQAVLEAIRKCHCEEWVKADIGAPIEALTSVTPAEKVERWIPVSERLPELNRPLLVTTYHRVYYGHLISESGNCGYPVFRIHGLGDKNRNWVQETMSHAPYSLGRIDAWMYLDIPEPYKASPTSCSTCILDRTDACTRGAGRAVDDEACEDYLASPTGAEGSDKE